MGLQVLPAQLVKVHAQPEWYAGRTIRKAFVHVRGGSVEELAVAPAPDQPPSEEPKIHIASSSEDQNKSKEKGKQAASIP